MDRSPKVRIRIPRPAAIFREVAAEQRRVDLAYRLKSLALFDQGGPARQAVYVRDRLGLKREYERLDNALSVLLIEIGVVIGQNQHL
ncbi:hypothetical protein D3C87_1609980 [compost metagenome]